MTPLHLGEGTTADTREDRDTPYRGVSCPSLPFVSLVSLFCPLFVPSVSLSRRSPADAGTAMPTPEEAAAEAETDAPEVTQ